MNLLQISRITPLLAVAAFQANAASVVAPLTAASDICYGGGTICLSGVTLTPGVPTVTQGDGNTLPTTDQRATSSIGLSGFLTITSGPPAPVTPFGSHAVNVNNRSSLTDPGTYQIQVITLDLSDPGLGLRESPTLDSLGQTQITDLGSGDFRIDSFFDVFTEISLDGGATWIPSDGSTRLSSDGFVPEPGTFGMLSAAGVLLLAARRRLRG